MVPWHLPGEAPMKKTVKKKLVLAKETVRDLTRQDLGNAVGGYWTDGCGTYEWLKAGTTRAEGCTK
jgi:hypothetical protein